MRKFRFKSPEERRIEQLENENSDLILQNTIQDMTIQSLQDENADILLKLAEMEVSTIV